MLRKFAVPARSCFLPPCRICSSVRVYFHASQVRRACSLVPLTTLLGLLTYASLLSCFASSPSPLPLANLPGLLNLASLLSFYASSPSLLARASCNLAESAHSCEFTFLLRKFVEPAPSSFLKHCRIDSPVRVYFHASQVRRACSLVPLATLLGLLTYASLLSCFASSPSLIPLANLPGLFNLASLLSFYASSPCLLARASCNLTWSAHLCEFTFMLRKFAQPDTSCELAGSPSLLARASCHLAGSAHPCEFTFMLRKFDEPACSCFLPPCRVCSPVRFFFDASQFRRACWLVLLATLPGLLTRASLLSCFASSMSLLARASCHRAGSAHPCDFSLMLRNFVEPAGSCFLLPCRVCSPVRAYFHASQPSLLARPSCDLTGSTHPCELPFMLRKFAEPARSCFCDLAGSAHPCEFTFLLCKFPEPAWSCNLQPCQVFSPVRVYFHASQVHRGCSLVLLATLPGLLTRASLLSCFASSPRLLARASCDLAGSAHPCEFTLMLRMFAEPARLCHLQPFEYALPCEFTFMLRKFAQPAGSSPSLLARASCDLAGSAHPCEFTLMLRMFAEPARLCHLQPFEYALPCEFTFMLRKFAEPARSCLLQPYLVCSPMRVYFHASQVRPACWLVPLANLPGLRNLTSLLSCFASSPSLLARASCNLTWSAHLCEFTFMLRKFAQPAGSCRLRTCRFTFMLRKFAELARSYFLPPGRVYSPVLVYFHDSVCSPVRTYFHASQVSRACWLDPLATLPGLLTHASFLSCFASSPSLLARAFATLPGLLTRASFLSCFASSPSPLACSTCNPAVSPHPCELTFMLRNFAEPTCSCFLQPCRVCTPVRVYFHALQVPRACSVVQLATLPGLLTSASLLSCFTSSSSLLGRATCNLSEYAHPCEFTLMLRKFADPAGSCFVRPCRVCSPVLVYFHDPQVRRTCSLVSLATLSGLLARASLLSCFASSLSLLARATCNLAKSSHLWEFTFMLRKFTEAARPCFLRPCRVCSPVRVYYHASQVHRGCTFVLLATLLGLLTRASLLSFFATWPSLLSRASCDLVCSPVRVYFDASEVRRACWFEVLATLPGLLTRTSFLACFASSPSLLPRASCNLAPFADPCGFTFMLGKLDEPARSFILQPSRVCSPVRVYFHSSKVRRVCSIMLLATLPGLLTSASLLSCFASLSCLLTRASCGVCSPVQVYFHTSQVRRAFSLMLLATMPGLLIRASLLSCFASSPSLLARATCELAGSAHPCEFTFMLRKFAQPAGSCHLRTCRVCSTLLVYFHASQVRPACWLVPLANLPGLLNLASLLSFFASSLSLLARSSCNLAKSAHPCEFTFLLRRFAEPAPSSFLQCGRVDSPVLVYFHASQICRASTIVPLATLPSLLVCTSLLSWFTSSPRLLARASCDLAGSANPCEFTFMLCKFAEPTRSCVFPTCQFTFMLRKFAVPARSCFLPPCRICSSVRVYFHASQVHRACSLVPLATLLGLLAYASLLSCFASSPSLLARATCNLTWSARLCEFTFMLRKFTEPARSCHLQPYLVCSPMRVYFHASQVHRACSLVPLATLLGLLAYASLLSCFASSPSLLARATCNLTWSARLCEFTFMLRKFTEPARSCHLQPYLVCSPMRVYFHASQVHRACSLVPLATLLGLLAYASLLSCFASSPSLLARATCNLTWSARLCEFTFMLRKFTEPARSCHLQPYLVCSPMRVYFHASQVHRACSLVPLATLLGLLAYASLLSCFASSPSLLARATCNLTWSARLCEFTFMLRKFTEPARSCHLQPYLVCSPMRVYFHASQVHRACSLVPLATLLGLLAYASLLSCFASSPSLLARATCNLTWSARLCEFTFMLRKFTEPARSCHLQPYLVCSPMRVYFHASQVHRACSLVPLATLLGLLAYASLLSCFASSPSLLARATCNLTWSARLCEFTFMLRKFTEPARSCHLQPYLVCSPMRVYFHASQVHRACSLVPLATLLGLLAYASLLSCFASSPSLLARATCNLTWSARLCEFTFMLRKFTEPARSCHLQPYLVCSPMRVYFHASQVHRACSLVPLATLLGLLAYASLLSCFASSPSLLARATCNLTWSARLCEFTFMLRKFVQPASSCLLRPCRVYSPVLVYFHASQVRRACLLLLLATVTSLLTRAILL
ncbi:hypothetical protein CRG98_042316 [Punica granatum]|uniref:Uncharacterized protein n=1 Tax=Punica granatum TaxID=22663 RepID=A0A2I0I0C4_PUNGR|nr:hypothetical protein CRG98_042316 [Punica granatum]